MPLWAILHIERRGQMWQNLLQSSPGTTKKHVLPNLKILVSNFSADIMIGSSTNKFLQLAKNRVKLRRCDIIFYPTVPADQLGDSVEHLHDPIFNDFLCSR